MANFIWWTVGLYVLYKLIFNFILPTYANAKRIRKQFRDVQETMQQAQQRAHAQAQQQAQAQPTQNPNFGKKSSIGEYIDFEEVK